MLILSRRPSEGIVLPGLDILIRVLSVRGGTCRIGMDAPPEVTVLREELFAELGEIKKGYLLNHLPRNVRHDILNEVNAIQLGLTVIASLANAGKTDSVEEVAQQLLTQTLALRNRYTQQEDFAPEPAATVKAGGRSKSGQAGEKSARVLIVEDDDNERELLRRLLTMSGANVATATSGLDAMNWLDGHSAPDCIVSDMVMRDGDGASLVRNVRKNPTLDQTRVIAMSGLQISETGLAADDVDAWLMKPLDVDVLLRLISPASTTAA